MGRDREPQGDPPPLPEDYVRYLREQQVQETAGQAAQQGQQAAQQAGGGQQQPDATDAARQKADELGVDLSQVQGSGANGRITVRDVLSAANQG
jgi:pyruvate/2-oxoglutarate dehydrogenase complex dihydrolipoamide acyltransferase (E2) component